MPSTTTLIPHRRRWSITHLSSFAFAALAGAALIGMFALFAIESIPVWQAEGGGYITGTTWHYFTERFGAAPMIYGTLAVAGIALLLAAPIGIGTAVFTAELLPPRLRLLAKAMLELLAGVPSVIYGLLGILLLRTYVYDALDAMGLEPYSGDTLLTAGLLLAVMVLPTIITLSDDALRSVPGQQRQAARGLGLTRGQTIWSIALPQARRGLVAAVLLALGRALGETIAVLLVVGKRDNQWPDSLLSPMPLTQAGQTLTTKLGSEEVNTAYGDPLHWAAVVGLGLILLVIVAAITLVGAQLSRGSARRGGRHA